MTIEGIDYSDARPGGVGMFRLTRGGMIGGALTFGSNAWKIAFDDFNTTGT